MFEMHVPARIGARSEVGEENTGMTANASRNFDIEIVFENADI